MPRRKLYSLVDLRGSRDVLLALLPEVRTWDSAIQAPAVLDLLERCCGPHRDKLLDDYAVYLHRLDRDTVVEGRRLGDLIDEARERNPSLGKLLDRTRGR